MYLHPCFHSLYRYLSMKGCFICFVSFLKSANQEKNHKTYCVYYVFFTKYSHNAKILKIALLIRWSTDPTPISQASIKTVPWAGAAAH